VIMGSGGLSPCRLGLYILPSFVLGTRLKSLNTQINKTSCRMKMFIIRASAAS
jgi:hypothetical protein